MGFKTPLSPEFDCLSPSTIKTPRSILFLLLPAFLVHGPCALFGAAAPAGTALERRLISGPVGAGIGARIEAHAYASDDDDVRYGREFGVALNRKLDDNLSVLVKATVYEAQFTGAGAAAADKTKVWAQFDFRL